MRKLHPKVLEFKQFVQHHPGIIKEVHAKEKKWQDFFEDWYMFGEDDEMWEKYKNPEQKKNDNTSKKTDIKKENDFVSQLFAMIKNIDMNEMQNHINTVSNAISNVQQLIENFQGFKPKNQNPRMHGPIKPNHPFYYQKD